MILLQFEEVVRLHDLGNFTENFRPFTVGQTIFFLQKLLLARRVKAFVLRLVDFALVEELLEHLTYDFLVPLLGGADKIVVGDIELGQKSAEFGADLVGKLLRRDAFFLGALLDLLAVFIDAGEKMYAVAHLAAEARDHVREHLFVGVPQVGRTVHVINRGGNIKRLHR